LATVCAPLPSLDRAAALLAIEEYSEIWPKPEPCSIGDKTTT
jgi:hypothetical protein